MKKIIILGCSILLILICMVYIKNTPKDSGASDSSHTAETSAAEIIEPGAAEEIYTNSFGISNSFESSDANNSEDKRAGSEDTDTDDVLPTSANLTLSILYQYPELPAGCEAVSLTMLLNYYGYELDKTDIIDNYLIYSDNYVTGYYGNPYASTGGGCYAPGMTDTANNFLSQNGSQYTAVNISGTEFDDLLTYIANGTPVLIWTTIGLGSCSKDYDEVYYNDTVYSWDFMEHCVVLTGYDLTNNTVTVYDPIDGIMTRDKDRFEEIYNEMYRMCVVLE